MREISSISSSVTVPFRTNRLLLIETSVNRPVNLGKLQLMVTLLFAFLSVKLVRLVTFVPVNLRRIPIAPFLSGRSSQAKTLGKPRYHDIPRKEPASCGGFVSVVCFPFS